MKKLFLMFFVFMLLVSTWFAYDVQPWDNALLTKIYDRIDEKMITDHHDLLMLEDSMNYLMMKYWTTEKNRYFLEKIQEYLIERLYYATTSSTFVCLQENVQNNDTVTITYMLTTEEWKTISLSKWEYTLEETAPLLFNPGSGNLIEWIETSVLWMKVNERKWVDISYRNAYWSYAEALVIKLPRQLVEQISEHELAVDQRVHMSILIDGKLVKKEGFIKEIGTESVIVNFNKPLAWHDITGMIKLENLFKHCS